MYCDRRLIVYFANDSGNNASLSSKLGMRISPILLYRMSPRSSLGNSQVTLASSFNLDPSGKGIQEGGDRAVVPKQWTGGSDHKQPPLHQQVHYSVRSVSWGGMAAFIDVEQNTRQHRQGAWSDAMTIAGGDSTKTAQNIQRAVASNEWQGGLGVITS